MTSSTIFKPNDNDNTERRLMKGMIKSNIYVSNELSMTRRHARQDTEHITNQFELKFEKVIAKLEVLSQDVQLLRAVLRCFDEKSED